METTDYAVIWQMEGTGEVEPGRTAGRRSRAVVVEVVVLKIKVPLKIPHPYNLTHMDPPTYPVFGDMV